MRTPRGTSWFTRAAGASALVLLAAGCGVFDAAPRPEPIVPLPGQSTGVFTTARPTFAAAVDDFFAEHEKTPAQPLEFPHYIHVRKKVMCTEYCHEGVTSGAVAGLPSVRTCMICHKTIATDRPRIKRITELREQGRDLAWQRVFDYPPASHVRFNHAPHIRAGVECATCHGAIAQQGVAQRNVDLTMGVCVNCHKEKKAPTDCLTCHY